MSANLPVPSSKSSGSSSGGTSKSSSSDKNRPKGERDPLLTCSSSGNSKRKKKGGSSRGRRGGILEAAQRAKAAREAAEEEEEERYHYASVAAAVSSGSSGAVTGGESRGGGVIRARRSSRSPVQQEQQRQQSPSLHFRQPNSSSGSMLRTTRSFDTNSTTASSSLLQQQQQQQPAEQDHPDTDEVLLVRTSASLPQHHYNHDGYEAIEDEAIISATQHHRHHRGFGAGDALTPTTTPAQAAAAAAASYSQTRSFGGGNSSSSGGNNNSHYRSHPNSAGTNATTRTPGINPRNGDNNNNSPPSVASSATGGSADWNGGDHRHQHNNNNNNNNRGPPVSSSHTTTRSTATHHSQQQQQHSQQQQPAPLLEIPEEIYVVRKAALQVLKPLTKTWVVISVGFALTVLFGTSRWTRLMPGLPFWFILLPCWVAHCGLLWLHVLSAQALSHFIADANESRQRPDSRDHLNRTEYLPLLQRSLKFGLKTGLLSFAMFLFEILIYVRMAKGTISLSVAFIPLWLLVLGGIIDGLICKTQHFLRVVCWVLAFTAMLLTCLKVDHHMDAIRWRIVISPVVAFLSIASGTLIYIVYGHQVGYYRLTESQLTAGNLYSLAALICMVLMIMIGEVIPLSRPVEIETRLFVVILAPLVICLVGMGAWVVSRDEFGRLLLYGGQSAVHPMKLRWEAKGWTSVQGKGVTVIPMFGEVAFQPLERPFELHPKPRVVEMCMCCSGSCYPYEEEDEETAHLTDDIACHPYLDPTQSTRHTYIAMRGSV